MKGFVLRRIAVPLVACAVVVLVGIGPAAQVRSRAVPVRPAGLSELRQWDARIDAMIRDGDLRIRKVREDTLMPGRTHERLDQYYEGVRVWGGDMTRQLDRSVTVSVSGNLYTGINLDTTPALSPEDAKAIVEKQFGVELGSDRLPELVVLPVDGGGFALAYRARVVARGDIVVCFLDAASGREIWRYSDLETQSAVGVGPGVYGDQKKVSAYSLSGLFYTNDMLRPPVLRTFDLRGDVQKVEDFLNGKVALGLSDMASDSDNVWTDGPVVDGHVYAGWTYDYLYKRLGRRGLDGNNSRILILVHPVRRQDFQSYYDSQNGDVIGLYYLNAFYAGSGVTVFGEGLPPGWVLLPKRQTVTFFTAGLDTVSHEIIHGLTDYSSNLVYENESGALNEAFSDIMGTSVEFYFQPPGDGPLKADYLMGEEIFVPGGLRSLANPAATGNPDHYSKRYVGKDDNGGVHTNSTIASHAFYLAIEGGTNRTSGLSVQGVGAGNREQIEKVFYRAFVYLLASTAKFADARAATTQAARDLYGAGSTVERAVLQAWTAVGVN